MTAAGPDAATERRRRFLAPQHGVDDQQAWQALGTADTPAADALCELYLQVDGDIITAAGFALYGPPIAVACADWLCEALHNRTIETAHCLSMHDLQTALALAPQERYGAMLVLDALLDAITNLEASECND